MDEALLKRITQSYEAHPLRAETILQRVRARRGTLECLNAMDLAVDEETWITDQNHCGGVQAVRSIARAVGLRGDERILDVGTGLGGVPRVLAHLYGCVCHGVELTESRYCDAVHLTRLVGLDHNVTFTLGDFLEVDLPDAPFDLVTGQGAFMHFPDPAAAYRRCSEVLTPGGWLAVEDGFLNRDPAGGETTMLEMLSSCWNGRFDTMENTRERVARAGLVWHSTKDMSKAAAEEYRSMPERLTGGGIVITPEERLGMALGAELLASGLIGAMRLLARKPTTEGKPQGSG